MFKSEFKLEGLVGAVPDIPALRSYEFETSLGQSLSQNPNNKQINLKNKTEACSSSGERSR